MKTCPRCYHPMDEHDFQRCNHLAGTAERCRCWVGNPARVIPRWYGPLVAVLLLIIASLALTGCFQPVSSPVTCTGVRPMVCDCADSCVTTRDEVVVKSDESCVGVTVCWAPDAGWVRGCDGTMLENCR